MKISLFILVTLLSFTATYGGWQRTYGFGWGHETAINVIETLDNGYLICGGSDSILASGTDLYLVRIDTIGDLVWQKLYGGIEEDGGNCILSCEDGDYYIVGSTKSYGSGDHDGWLLKINEDGDTLWTRTYGTSGTNRFFSGVIIGDGLVMVGYTSSISEDNFDFWVVKTDFDGNIMWENEYGGSEYECCYSVEYIKDVGFILVGSTRSFGIFSQDIYIIHTDLDGDTMWTRTFGGYGEDVGYSVVKTPDYGFVIAGYTTSYIPVTECVLLLKMNMVGDTVWSKIYGDYDTDISYSVDMAEHNGLISCGCTDAFGAGGFDFWLLRLDRRGDTLWTKTYGGPNDDRGFCVKRTSDEGFIIVGSTYSYGSGGRDVYVVKTDSLGETEWIREVPTKPKEFSLNVYPNPFNASCIIEAPLGAEIEIFDINGRLVLKSPLTRLTRGGIDPGFSNSHCSLSPAPCSLTTTWTPDESVGSGVYLVRAKAGKEVITKKIIYLK